MLFCLNFHGLEVLRGLPRVRDLHRDLPSTLFHLVNFLFCCNFHQSDLETCLEAVSLRQRPNILARQHVVANYFKFNLAGTTILFAPRRGLQGLTEP